MASLATIKPGDIVECDIKGRRGYALVTDKQGRSLSIKPLTPGFTWRNVTAYQIINHWRKTKNTKKIGVKVKTTGPDADE